MRTEIRKAYRKPTAADTIVLIKANSDLDELKFNESELEYIKKEHRNKKDVVVVNKYKNRCFVVFGETKGVKCKKLECFRDLGNTSRIMVNDAGISRIVVKPLNATKDEIIAFAEGMSLGNYQFLKYKTGERRKENALNRIEIYSNKISEEDIKEFQVLIDSVTFARNMINEPDSYMTATQLAEEAKWVGEKTGAKVEVFNKKKIESLKMGGLLAVNRGSVNPPTFTNITWKPDNHINKKPVVLVGKGVVYDTGGLSLKPSNFMDNMKSDMSGAAAVIAAMYAISKMKLPVYVIGLIPATDNRPDGNAYTPGDVVTMYDKTTVEVLNTDAEGRMILADALSYAKKYNPELVIDIATLTGAASRAIGPQGIVGMSVNSDIEFMQLKRNGDAIHERIVEFPMWDEYKEMLKSDIADMKNIGGIDAGAITAGKFLEHFTDYPYIHLDIAGPAFISKASSYRTAGATGVGVRLFYSFIKAKALETDKK